MVGTAMNTLMRGVSLDMSNSQTCEGKKMGFDIDGYYLNLTHNNGMWCTHNTYFV